MKKVPRELIKKTLEMISGEDVRIISKLKSSLSSSSAEVVNLDLSPAELQFVFDLLCELEVGNLDSNGNPNTVGEAAADLVTQWQRLAF